jgi:hypothetical protein
VCHCGQLLATPFSKEFSDKAVQILGTTETEYSTKGNLRVNDVCMYTYVILA